MLKGHIANLLVQQKSVHLAEHQLLDGPTNGLGDLTAALFLGNYLANRDALNALQKTTSSVHEAMMTATRVGADELVLEECAASLANPRMAIETRALF